MIDSKHHWQEYWPLIALILISALAAGALTIGFMLSFMGWMRMFMGIFLCSFAMLKIFDLHGFAKGFAMYDLLAHRFRPYAYLYPFLELTLGLAYLSFAFPTLTYIATILLMGFGALGVTLAVRRGLNIDCPCMGNTLKVPLSTVTITENASMALMAVFMLFAI